MADRALVCYLQAALMQLDKGRDVLPRVLSLLSDVGKGAGGAAAFAASSSFQRCRTRRSRASAEEMRRGLSSCCSRPT